MGVGHYGNVPGTPDEVGGRVSVPVSCSDQAWKVSGVGGHLPVLASLTDLIYLNSPEAFPHEPGPAVQWPEWWGRESMPSRTLLFKEPLDSLPAHSRLPLTQAGQEDTQQKQPRPLLYDTAPGMSPPSFQFSG